MSMARDQALVRQTSFKVEMKHAESFLRSWFRDLKEHELIEIRLLAPAEQKFFASVDDCIDWLQQVDFSTNVYYGVHPRLRERGQAEDVSSIIGLFADIDGYKAAPTGNYQTQKHESGLRAINLIGDSRRLTMIDSGNGIHILKPFDTPQSVTQSVRDLYERAQRGFVARLGGDPRAVDIARVLRLPGSMNVKSVPWKLCQLMELS